MRPGDRAVAVRSPSPTGSGNVSALASPITSASSRHLTPQGSPSHLSKVSTATGAASERMPAPPSQAVGSGGSSSKSGNTGTGAGGTNANANANDAAGTKVKAEQEIVDGDGDKKHKLEGAQNSPAPPDGSNRYPIITIGGRSASPIVSQSPKAAAPKQVDPHDQRTPKHNHLSAAPRADRPPSPIQGPSSAAAAAAAAAKALRTGQGMMTRTPPGNNSGGKAQSHNSKGWENRLDNNSSPDSKAPPHNHHQPFSHQPHPFAYGGYQPHAIPHSPDDNAAASAAYYAAMYGHNPYSGYYNRGMTTNWPEEAEDSERSASIDSEDRGTKKAAEAAYRHFDERDRAYLQHHRQHQHQHQQPPHYYQHHSEHHRGFFHHPGNGSAYCPPPHVAREYIPPDEHVGGDADGKKDVPSKRSDGSDSSKGKNSGKVVMGGASPIHVARGMSTSPLASNNTLAAGRHVTPHHHNHNTRHSSRKKMKEEEPTPPLSASSIFRGRPGPSMSSRAADDFDDDDEDSPQRILLSLSKGDSFEDRGFGSAGSGGMVQMVGGDSTAGGAVNSDNIGSSSTASSANGNGSNKKSATKDRGGKTKNTGKAVVGPSRKSSATSKKSSKSPSKVGKKSTTKKGDGKTPSSPDEPPRIQHSFSQSTKRGNDPFYFDVSESDTLYDGALCAWYYLCSLRTKNSTSLSSCRHSLYFSHKSPCEHQMEGLLCWIIKGP